MQWVILILAILIGMFLGKSKLGYVISVILFIVYWRIIIANGYTIYHNDTIVVGKESGFNGPVADWFTIISSSLLFAFVSSLFFSLLSLIFKKVPFLDDLMGRILVKLEPTWNKEEKKEKGIEYVKKLNDEEKLKFIAQNGLVTDVVIEAIKKIDNQDTLYVIARNDYKPIEIRKKCVDKLNDNKLLNDLLLYYRDKFDINGEFKKYVEKKIEGMKKTEDIL